MVHAAGNDAANIDTAFNFPSATFVDGQRPSNWITIGASGDKKAGGLTASFSNYGKKEVDVFSPGVKIYSTTPGGNSYANLQGTSMAAPVVSGLAALIMSYYPDLTAVQVKEIIENSVSKPTAKVAVPGEDSEAMMSDISVYGGIVNAYKAVQLADEKSKSAPAKKSKSKSKKRSSILAFQIIKATLMVAFFVDQLRCYYQLRCHARFIVPIIHQQNSRR
ncbi:S8 family serine peptidase [Niabella ginsengisoli]|nr:S8 family serine peptidase [Niabella ginsengisoli]